MSREPRREVYTRALRIVIKQMIREMPKSIRSRMAPRTRRAVHNGVMRPRALTPGGVLRVISPASASDREALSRGVTELERLGYRVQSASPPMEPEGYFAGTVKGRVAEFANALLDPDADALIGARGGYGSAALLDGAGLSRTLTPKLNSKFSPKLIPKLLIGYSDITVLHAYLWARWRWTSLYGPMVAAGFDGGADRPGGYDLASFLSAVDAGCGNVTRRRVARSSPVWSISLGGETLVSGSASGVLLGGCLTLLQTTLGTPWELDTRGAILLLEDRGVKPYQLDRMLVHLAQAGKFRGVRGIVLGEFPDCDSPAGSGVTVRDVCRRVLAPLRVPVTFGAAVGHTPRPIRTVPLGVRARLLATGEGKLEILEPAVSAEK
jgi:muramoyltetrapeptide carboxypeptidase